MSAAGKGHTENAPGGRGRDEESRVDGLAASVRRLIEAELGEVILSLGVDETGAGRAGAGKPGAGEAAAGETGEAERVIREGFALLVPGKMLRTRLAGRLSPDDGADRSALDRYCAAIEMAHTATLCHDDVIDSGLVRRAHPALWTRSGPTAAVLIGDMLLTRALTLVVGTDAGRLVGAFVSKMQEVCSAEAEQELFLRGKELDVETCLGLARRKTGPLFAFAGLAVGGDDAALSSAAAEAGYRIGTAYQVFDDLVDVAGSEMEAGKTLGTDAARRKFTIPSLGKRPEDGSRVAAAHVRRLCAEAVECLERWPRARAGLEAYIECDLKPLFDPLFKRASETGLESSTAGPRSPPRGGATPRRGASRVAT